MGQPTPFLLPLTQRSNVGPEEVKDDMGTVETGGGQGSNAVMNRRQPVIRHRHRIPVCGYLPCHLSWKLQTLMHASITHVEPLLLPPFCFVRRKVTDVLGPGNDPEPEPTEPPEKTMELPVIEPVVLYEKADVKITALELSYDRWFGPQLKVRIENASEKDLTFSVHEGAVNGFMVDLSLYTSVAHRAETTEFITISESDLKLVGIETIDSIEFEVLAYASDNWETYFDTDVLTIETGGASEFTYDEAGEVLYDANGVRVIYQGLTEEEAFGTGLKLYAINSSDQTVTITLKDVSINGHEVDSYASCTLLPNRRAVTSYTFLSSAIKENGIETFETATITLHLYNAKTWLDIADSVPIELIF